MCILCTGYSTHFVMFSKCHVQVLVEPSFSRVTLYGWVPGNINSGTADQISLGHMPFHLPAIVKSKFHM